MKFSFNMLYFIKKQYFKTQLINTEHRTQDTDTGLRTQTHAKNTLRIYTFSEHEKLIKISHLANCLLLFSSTLLITMQIHP